MASLEAKVEAADRALLLHRETVALAARLQSLIVAAVISATISSLVSFFLANRP